MTMKPVRKQITGTARQRWRTRPWLDDAVHSLNQAIARSPEARHAMARLREQGLEPRLVLGVFEERGPGQTPSESEIPEGEALRQAAEFRINASDLFFLKSIGIDPTRRGRSTR